MSVNVSARELTELDLAERVQESLKLSRLPAHALCLEVSEEAVLRDPERARAALSDVKRLGAVDRARQLRRGPVLSQPSAEPTRWTSSSSIAR